MINTEKNIFYSAYMTNFVQFNDLDPRNSVDLEADSLWQEDWISCKKEEDITITIESTNTKD